MKKSVQLPIVQPYFSAYQYQGSGGAILASNPSINNWYINQCIHLKCCSLFVSTAYPTPDVVIENSSLMNIPFIETQEVSVRFLKGKIHAVIRTMLDEGYYVYLSGVDDYYVNGKSLYHQQHLLHDGLICGYDQNDKTYTVFSYDSKWVYRTYKTPQTAIERGMLYPGKRQNYYGSLCAIRPKNDIVQLDPELILQKLQEYLENTADRFQADVNEEVTGIAVHDFLVLYLGKLQDGSIRYERRDHRVFRILKEHKTVMCERIRCLEKAFDWDERLSTEYEKVVHMAEQMRMIYAFYMKKQRNELLTDLQKKTLAIKEEEETLLKNLTKKLKGALQHDTVEQTT